MKKILYYIMPILKVLLFLLFFILCGIPFGLLKAFNLFPEITPSLLANLLFQFILVLLVLSALLITLKVFKSYNFRTVGLVNQNALKAFAKGAFIGFSILLICGALAMLFGNVEFSMGKFSFMFVLGYFILYILVSIFEELLFRTFPLFVFAERYGPALAIILTSLLFSLVHLTNPGFTWIALINITLAGIFLAINVIQRRNVYWAIGMHFGWNFTQGILLGYKVSGTDAVGILTAQPLGEAYLSGGSFGIESSVYCTLMLLILITFILIRYQTPSMMENKIEGTNDEVETRWV